MCILMILIIFATIILIFSKINLITYCGVAMIIILIFLSIDCYYRTVTKEFYEDIIKKFSELINLITKL